MRRTPLLAGIVVVIAVLVAACSSVVNGTGRGPTGAVVPTAAPPTGLVSTGSIPTVSVSSASVPSLSSAPVSPPVFPSSPTTVAVSSPVMPLPSLTTSSAAAPTDADITSAHYKVPHGFVKGANYHPVRPLTATYEAAYAVPRNERTGMDVLSLVLYRLGQRTPVGTAADQLARVKAFNRVAQAKRLSPITQTQIGGRLAFEVSLSEQPDYRYVSWFVIGTGHVLQVSCQVGQQVNKVAKACDHWVRSVRIS